jgi:hypothetical protein
MGAAMADTSSPGLGPGTPWGYATYATAHGAGAWAIVGVGAGLGCVEGGGEALATTLGVPLGAGP